MHGLAWLPNALDVELLQCDPALSTDICDYVNLIISTVNPAISPNGSDASGAPQPD